MALTCKTDLSSLNIGDYVWCKYTATSGAVGTFSDIATKQDADVASSLIPVASSASPDGYFKFICADTDYKGRKILIADRNVQNTINWDALNTAGIATGSGLPYKFHEQLSVIPIMTSNTAPSGVASASSIANTTSDAWYAFNGNTSTGWVTPSGTTTGWLKYDFGLGNEKTITNYSIYPHPSTVSSCPKSWTFEGSNDDTNWTILDTQTNQTGWTGYYKYFNITNSTSFRYYRLNISANNGDASYLRVFEFNMSESNIPFQSSNFSLRLLTGGISSTDTDNEWNNYIVNSTLGGVITAGDNAIWNWSGLLSWCSSSFTSANRAYRGSASVGGTGSNTTTTSSTSVGFRPVLLIESLSIIKYLLQDGTNIKILDLNNIWQILGITPVTEDMFKTNGMDDLSPITQILTSGILPMVSDGVVGVGKQFSSTLENGITSVTSVTTS